MTALQSMVVWSVAAAVVYLAIGASARIAAALRAGGRREDTTESHEALSASRFTIPVSLVVPVLRETPSLSEAVSSLLALNYPELELVVVTERVPQAALDALARDWQLEAREFFYRRAVHTAEVRRIYRSGRDSRVVVVDKAPGGLADAINCGVNVARYRYVVPVQPDVVFGKDALLALMAPALRDPGTIVGVSHHVVGGGVFQRLAAIRAVMDSKLSWKSTEHGLGSHDGVVAWRRDALLEAGGFSVAAADPDLDMMFRLQTSGAERSRRVVRGAGVFGRVGPRPLRDVLESAGRRQSAALHLVRAWASHRALAPRTLALFVSSELLTPLAQAWIVLATAAGAAAGWFGWSAPALAIALLSFGNAAVTSAALLSSGALPGAPEDSALPQLLLAGPIEFVLYRPALALARIAAALSLVPSGSVGQRR